MAGHFGLILKQELMRQEYDREGQKKLEQRVQCCKGLKMRRTWEF